MTIDIMLFKGNGKKFGFTESYMVELLTGKTNEELRKKIQKTQNPIIVLGDPQLNRFILSNKKVDVLVDPHNHAGEDFLHSRNSGMNHILAKMAHDNNIAIGFSVTNLINAKNRIQAMGRIMQNVQLCRKYKVKMILASFSGNEIEQRQIHDIKSLARCLKMTPLEAKYALEYAESLFKHQPR